MKKKIFLVVAILLMGLVLTACKKNVVVTFDSQGGSAVAEVEVKKGETVSKPANPTKEGYVFVEWQLDGVAYDFSTEVKKNITLVAKWEVSNPNPNPNPENKVTVTFDSQGGSAVASATVTKGGKVSEPEAPTKEGHVFAGWQLNGVDFDFDSKVNENITLVAVWKTPLVTPTNVRYANNKISWDNVSAATSYEVWVDGVKNVVTTNEYTVDLTNEGLAVVSVVAISDTGRSEATEETIFTLPCTVEEIIEQFDVDEEYANQYFEEFKLMFAAQVKFGITFEEVSQMEDPSSLLQYVAEGKTSDVIGFFAVMASSRYTMNELEKPEMPEVTLQTLFDEMKTQKAYVSSATNYAEDKKFVNLIVPIFGYMMYDYCNTDYRDVYYYVERMLFVGENYLSIIREDDTFTFTKYNGEEYVLTAAEIESIAKYYILKNQAGKMSESLSENLFDNEIKMFNYLQQMYIYDRVKNITEAAHQAVFETLKNFEKNAATLNATATKLYEAFETAMGYQEKLEELMSSFQNADTEEKLTTAIEDARNFAIQVVELLEDNLPTEEEINVLVDTIKGFGYVLGTDEDMESLYKSLETLLNTAITTINTTLSVVEEISVADIETLLALMENPEDENAIATVEKILELLEGKLSGITISGEFDLEKVLELVTTMTGYSSIDQIKSLLSINLNIQFNEEQMKEIEEEITSILEYVEAYDTTKLEEVLTGMYTGSADMQEALEEVFDVVEYLAKYITSEKVVKYESYLRSYLARLGYDSEQIEDAYQLFKESIGTIAAESVLMIKLELVYGMIDYLETDKLDGLSFLIEIAKTECTAEQHKAFMNFLAKFEQIDSKADTIDESYKQNLYYVDYEGSLESLAELVGKYQFELTEEEKKLISDNDLFDWVYPDYLEIVEVENGFAIQIIEEVSQMKPELAFDGYYWGYLSIVSYGSGENYAKEVDLEGQVSEKQILITFEEIRKALSYFGIYSAEDYYMQYPEESLVLDCNSRATLSDGENGYYSRAGEMDITYILDSIFTE